MAENAFLTAKDMAQELVRQRVEPDEVSNLLGYLRDNSEAGGEAFFAYLAEPGEEGQPRVSEALATACEANLRELQGDVDSMKDILGWAAGFMRYYRGEGNRPEPNRRPSQPRPRSRPEGGPRRSREPVVVTAPMESLQVGQMLEGTVKRVMPYGVFVSVGAERDGLVHVSEITDGYVSDPSQVVNVNDEVEVWVKSIDLQQKRISLTMKGAEAAMAQPQPRYQDDDSSSYQQQERQPRRERRDDRRESGSSYGGSGSRDSGSRSSAPHGDSGPRRRSTGPRRPSGSARLYEDDMPKEATAMAEALRRAMEASAEASEDESTVAESASAQRNRRAEELAEAHRRTLAG